MIDLTPLDVRKKKGDFRPKLRGYDPEEVDAFLQLVAERMEELVKENLSLSEATGRMEIQLKALEDREKAVQDALVTAQKLREDVESQSQREAEGLKDQARREVELLKAQAETEIERRLGEAESLIRERQRALEELERNRQKFLKAFRSLLEREMDSVEVEEARRPLDDAPLELNLRGWTPASKGEPTEESIPEATEESIPEATAESTDEAGAGEDLLEESGVEPDPDDEGAIRPGQEPLWLSSLLKDDDEKKLDE